MKKHLNIYAIELLAAGFIFSLTGCKLTIETKNNHTHSYGDYVSDGNATRMADGTKTRTCSCGAKETVTDTGSKTAMQVGDFILKDSTIIANDATLTDTEKSNVAAIVVRIKSGDTPALILGTTYGYDYNWCMGYATSYKDTVIVTGLYGDATSGLMDGSTGWSILKAACSDAETSGYYPAWEYCNNYGTNNSFGESLKDGWYLPSLAELMVIYNNKTTIWASFTKAGKSTFRENEYDYNYDYWTCNQSSESDGTRCARTLDFTSGSPSYVPKYRTADTYIDCVCAVRHFVQN